MTKRARNRTEQFSCPILVIVPCVGNIKFQVDSYFLKEGNIKFRYATPA